MAAVVLMLRVWCDVLSCTFEGPGSDPSVFNPTQLDTDNWVDSMVALGAKGAVLTAKHDSGHLLWPTSV